MRALLDTNLLLSYLLASDPISPVMYVVRAGFLGAFTILVPQELLEEMSRKAATKPYLAERISPAELQELLQLLGEVGELLPAIREPIPAVTRDRKDDYLLAHAIVAEADYLVTGDADLLVLGQVENMRIVTPRQFQEIIRESAL